MPNGRRDGPICEGGDVDGATASPFRSAPPPASGGTARVGRNRGGVSAAREETFDGEVAVVGFAGDGMRIFTFGPRRRRWMLGCRKRKRHQETDCQ